MPDGLSQIAEHSLEPLARAWTSSREQVALGSPSRFGQPESVSALLGDAIPSIGVGSGVAELGVASQDDRPRPAERRHTRPFAPTLRGWHTRLSGVRNVARENGFNFLGDRCRKSESFVILCMRT